jgi:hypothetical protein
VLGFDAWYIRAPHVLEEDALLRGEVQCQISSSAPSDNSQIVVQGPSDDVIRYDAFRITDLKLESWIDVPISNAEP